MQNQGPEIRRSRQEGQRPGGCGAMLLNTKSHASQHAGLSFRRSPPARTLRSMCRRSSSSTLTVRQKSRRRSSNSHSPSASRSTICWRRVRSIPFAQRLSALSASHWWIGTSSMYRSSMTPTPPRTLTLTEASRWPRRPLQTARPASGASSSSM